MPIEINQSAMNGLVADVRSRAADLDPSLEKPEISGRAPALEKYAQVLADILKALDRYKAMVEQDAAMVESVVREMVAHDQELSGLMRMGPPSPGPTVFADPVGKMGAPR